MPESPRKYRSALRDGQAQATRERILAAALVLMQTGGEASVDAIARQAGVERRSVFRHFATREALLTAAFQWLNDRIGADRAPADPAALVQAIRDAFGRMDAFDGPVRAALHSRAGREMRALTLTDRRAAFSTGLAPAVSGLPDAERRRVEALAHLLYSAAAWEVLKDYGGLSGAEAGETAAWAMEVILGALIPPPADRSTAERTTP